MSSPILLAIETSQREGGVALRDAEGRVHVEMLASNLRHDDDLLPAIDCVFDRATCQPADLATGAVGVSVGPGGFTGLRIAISTAKIMGSFLGAKLLAVPTALVAAETCAEETTPILVALATKGITFWATRLSRDQGGWRTMEPPGLADADAYPLKGIAAVVGDEFLPKVLRDRCSAAGVPVVELRCDPRSCLAVAARILEAGELAEPLSILPIYPRAPEAVTLWAKRHGGV